MLCVAYGAAPLPALFDTVSALSTVGLSAGVAGPQAADAVKAGLILAMLLGRVEFFALILLLRPATWAPRA
jgi:trk system potassium uptake protein TrkH